MTRILDFLPARRTQVYDVRRIIRAVVDKDSFFEIKARFGKVAATGLARLDGRSVGVVANKHLGKGGALEVGRAWSRERGWQCGKISVVPAYIKKKREEK